MQREIVERRIDNPGFAETIPGRRVPGDMWVKAVVARTDVAGHDEPELSVPNNSMRTRELADALLLCVQEVGGQPWARRS